jgi:uncharacterized membrane protein YoaK (UPF0700 family)
MKEISVTKAPWERFMFMIIITFVGGYMNAYTYITRHEILANMHTANMSKFGISMAQGKWDDALSFFLPIVMCILGAAFSEFIKKRLNLKGIQGDWRKIALLLEAVCLFILGLFPENAPDMTVTLPVSFFMGYQLCLFRKFEGTAHNTTICTGNLRNVGQLLFAALDSRTGAAWKKLFTFAALTFSFVLGTIPGTWLSEIFSTRAVWICTAILIAQSLWIFRYDNQIAAGNISAEN